MRKIDSTKLTDAELEAHERWKYTRVWSRSEYHESSPGLEQVGHAMRELRVQPEDTLLDFGAGAGKAVDEFRRRGVVATGLDLVSIHPLVRQACLWSLDADWTPADWGFCCDVLEHVPEHKLPASIVGMLTLTRRLLYLQVATGHEEHGARLVGEPLHLTVRPQAWWHERLARFTRVRKHWDDGYRCGFILDGAVERLSIASDSAPAT